MVEFLGKLKGLLDGRERLVDVVSKEGWDDRRVGGSKRALLYVPTIVSQAFLDSVSSLPFSAYFCLSFSFLRLLPYVSPPPPLASPHLTPYIILLSRERKKENRYGRSFFVLSCKRSFVFVDFQLRFMTMFDEI